ncbi:hypothetical protein [Echinimonas agarilytica]|uniref:Agl cluster protein AglQ n=1 Tax=Echinimonas agarilytica TaxID=1215918 RepID=A0AA42B9K8_9GAMM|nr:hypothetical protein [Echinimonas agarilytica]MCM2681487.1 hypothetical protein [Echinimonas agarilytica]
MMDSILHQVADKALDQLSAQGYVEGGHNGPYFDPETPVRNTAHWATTFAVLFKKQGDERYRKAVEQCITYLKSNAARPMQSAFFCRTSVRKDFSNGTIGQAWAIEGLVSGYQVTGDENCLELAKQTFLLHVFDERLNIWKIRNVDGSVRGFDMTFNHQLWLAAAGYVLLSVVDDTEIRRQCDAFMSALPERLRVYSNGLIKHDLVNTPTTIKKIRAVVDQVQQSYRLKKAGKTKQYKENGYHLFNIYAFALIKEFGGNVEFMKLPAFQKALAYCGSDELYAWQEESNRKIDYNNMKGVSHDTINIYGYSYNAPGFELPYIAKVFATELPAQNDRIKTIIEKQIEWTYDAEKASFSRNTEDENTLNARLYEYVRAL